MPKLILKYPVKPYIKYQDFGDSQACCENNNLPITKRKVVGKQGGVCPVGYIELYPLLGMKGHTGMDMFAPDSVPIYYAGPDGVVEEVQSEPERGLGLGIVTNEPFSFEGGEYLAKTRYWHLKSFNVTLGQKVKTGDMIALADNTGLSSGSHLHFELKPVLRNSKGVIYNVFQNNGYFGGVTPLPHFDGSYAAEDTMAPFVTNIYFGETSDEVMRLQKFLANLGYFNATPTGYYGKITQTAVYQFQSKYVAPQSIGYWIAVWINGGRSVLKLTREALNSLI